MNEKGGIMEDWPKRLVDEHRELNERIRRLHEAVENKDFMDGIGREKSGLLACQLEAMETYGRILAQRILIELEEGGLTLEEVQGK
jgi:hypothetical protein